MPLSTFHPLTRRWFLDRFGEPTEPQRLGWPAVAARQDTLIAAPTGSGKTLAAFLASLDRLLRLAIQGRLLDQTYVLYVSPLRALSNDIQRNLETPLAELLDLARAEYPDCPEIRALVRTGDTSATQRQRMVRKPPHILVTTPESLYLVLTGSRSREILRCVETVIVDEIHALARDKRGSHLSLSLERLDALVIGGSEKNGVEPNQLPLFDPLPARGGGPAWGVHKSPALTPAPALTHEGGGGVDAQPSLQGEREACRRPVRVGLSATQKPLDEIARFLTGARNSTAHHVESATQLAASGSNRENDEHRSLPLAASDRGIYADRSLVDLPTIIDSGHVRRLDLAVEVPELDLQAVCTHEHWAEIYERLVQLIGEHRSTLIFVNTRRLAERVSHQLAERLGEEAVSSHHGSLSHRIRHRTEQGLKQGTLKAVVATASLELGIDIGHIDLVCQIGTPRSIATLLQRVGRAGHSLGVVPKGRLFALTRDELIECLALVRAVYAGRLDRIEIPRAPLDILAQQIVATVASEEWDEDELIQLCRRAYPYRDLKRSDFDAVMDILSDGIAPRRGRKRAYLHHDRVGRRLRARRGARITAVTCGGAIPEIADYRVVTDDEEPTVVGTVDEDFAVESLAGDVFLLGNTSWRIRYVRGGEVVVRDAQGAPPTIPFWRGEAPGRTAELSAEVSRLREELAERVDDSESAAAWLEDVGHVSRHGAEQAVESVAAQKAATGMIPTHRRVLFERFFDESGGMQLVIHAPFGTRINRAWGLAMRKRFCRSFNFELQASADDNGIVLSLGPQHSFPLEQMFTLVHPNTAEEVLVQALLAVPFFTTRWRWNVTRALAVKRSEGGRRVPPPLQRMRADDLLSAVFPMQTACLENVVGDIEVPDHPLVRQTVDDCLHEAMDLEGWLDVLARIQQGEIRLTGLDSREPSPFSHELLNANPYAFLDDAPLEERRARAVSMRRALSTDALRDLGRLDPEVIEQVRRDCRPVVRDEDELHDVLLSLAVLPAAEGDEWKNLFARLRGSGRATVVERSDGPPLWAATERWPLVQALWPQATARPVVSVPDGVRSDWPPEQACVEVVRGRLELLGPITAERIAADVGLARSDVGKALLALEADGWVLRGRFTPESAHRSDETSQEWCERGLLARIQRLTLEGLRRQIEAVAPEQYLQFLLSHQHVHPETRLRGPASLLEVIEQLQGFDIPAADWERHVLPARLADYDPAWLDQLTFSGEVGWSRVRPRRSTGARPMKSFTRAVPISLMMREDLPWLLPQREPLTLADPLTTGTSEAIVPARPTQGERPLGGNALAVFEAIRQRGALFASQLEKLLQILPDHLDDALGELAAAGLVTSDGFAALRRLIGMPGPGAMAGHQRAFRPSRRSGRSKPGRTRDSGRWSLVRGFLDEPADDKTRVENWCRLLLCRYGVVFRDLLERESAAPPWYALRRCFQRLEARGEIRGGRFVAKVGGEQYALPQSIAPLRAAAAGASNGLLVLAATDPLNLFGRAVPGVKVPASPGNRVILEAGRLVGYRIGGEVRVVTDGTSEALHPRIAQALVSAGRR